MHPFSALVLALPAALLAIGTTTASAKLEIGQVGLTVVHDRIDSGGAPSKTAFEGDAASKKPIGSRNIHQVRSLKIEVRNNGREPESSINIRYWVFVTEMASRKRKVAGGGQETKNFKAHEIAIIEGAPISSSYEQASAFKPAVKPGAKSEVPAPDASGRKISGYGVQLIKDGKVISSSFTEETLKALVGAEGDKPGTVFEEQAATSETETKEPSEK